MSVMLTEILGRLPDNITRPIFGYFALVITFAVLFMKPSAALAQAATPTPWTAMRGYWRF